MNARYSKRTRCGSRSAKRRGLPVLAFVLAQIQDVKRLASLDPHQAFPSSVNGKAAQIGRNPSTALFLGDRRRRAGTDEEVRDEVSWVSHGHRQFDPAMLRASAWDSQDRSCDMAFELDSPRHRRHLPGWHLPCLLKARAPVVYLRSVDSALLNGWPGYCRPCSNVWFSERLLAYSRCCRVSAEKLLRSRPPDR